MASSVEGLKEFVPVDILPQEYGGKEQPIAILHGKFYLGKGWNACD